MLYDKALQGPHANIRMRALHHCIAFRRGVCAIISVGGALTESDQLEAVTIMPSSRALYKCRSHSMLALLCVAVQTFSTPRWWQMLQCTDALCYTCEHWHCLQHQLEHGQLSNAASGLGLNAVLRTPLRHHCAYLWKHSTTVHMLHVISIVYYIALRILCYITRCVTLHITLCVFVYCIINVLCVTLCCCTMCIDIQHYPPAKLVVLAGLPG